MSSPRLLGGLALVLLAALVVSAPACDSPVPSEPHACPEMCSGGPEGGGGCYLPEDPCSDTCGAAVTCTDDSACGPDRACHLCASGGRGVCSSKAVACNADGDCGDRNFACVMGRCERKACKTDRDCAGYCIHDTCYWLGYQCQYC